MTTRRSPLFSLLGILFLFTTPVQRAAFGAPPADEASARKNDSPARPPFPNSNPKDWPDVKGTIKTVANDRQLQSALADLKSNTTILLRAGVYDLSKSLRIGSDKKLKNIAIRGSHDNREDAVLKGPGAASPGSAEASGAIVIENAQNVFIANLTLQDAPLHGIEIRPGVRDVELFNLRFLNAGQSFISSPAGEKRNGAQRVRVQFSVFELAQNPASAEWTGIDIQAGTDWAIRNNLFRDSRPAAERKGPSFVIRAWRQSRETLVDGNTFIDAPGTLAIGSGATTPVDHEKSLVRNNFFSRTAGQTGPAAVTLVNAADARVLHNSILLNGTAANAVAYSLSTSSGAEIRHNLADGAIANLGGPGTAVVEDNVTTAQPAWFLQPEIGDLHLTESATAAINKAKPHPNAGADYDGLSRLDDNAPDAGADEYKNDPSSGSIKSSLPQFTTNKLVFLPLKGERLRIQVDLPKEASVKISVADSKSQDVRILLNETRPAGPTRVEWDGKNGSNADLPPGVYTLSLQTGGVTQTRKAVILK